MAVARTSTGTAVPGTAGITVLPGAGAAVGDYGIIIVETANQTMAAPSGWAKSVEGGGTGTAAAAGGTRLIIFTRVSIVSADISPGVTLADSGDHQHAVFLTYSGVDTGTGLQTSSETVGTPATTSASTGTIGIFQSGDAALAVIGTDRDNATVSTNTSPAWSGSPTGTNNGVIVNVSSTSGAGGGIIADEFIFSATPAGAVGFSVTITSSIYTSFLLRIPAAATNPALTGQSVTGTLGSVLAATALALTGGALTASQGSVAPQTSQALSSQSLAAAQGSTSPNITIALTGHSLSVSQGTISVASADVTTAISGQSVSVAQGAATPNITVALTGQSLSASLGSLGPATTKALSGQSLAVTQGSLAPATSKALSGQAVSLAQGSVGRTTTTPLSGQSLAVAQGIISVASSNVTAALTGHSLSAAQGSLTSSTALALLGQSAALSQGTLNSGLSLAVVGQAVAVSHGDLVALLLSGGQIKVDLGSYVAKPVKVWNGVAWVEKPLKRWTGALWQATSY